MAPPNKRVKSNEYVSANPFLTEIRRLLEAVKKAPSKLRLASDELKSDRILNLAAVQQNGLALKYAYFTMRHDKEIVMAAVKQNVKAYEYAMGLWNDRDFVLFGVQQKEILRSGVPVLEQASAELKNDRELVLAAVKTYAHSLKFASEELRNDKVVVLTAMAAFQRYGDVVGGSIFQYASKGLKNNKDVVLEAVQISSGALEYASDDLRNDKEIVLAAMKRNGYALQYASEDFRNDPEVVLAAVKTNGYWSALRYASEDLRNDKEIVLAAVKGTWEGLRYASEDLRNDPEVVAAALTSVLSDDTFETTQNEWPRSLRCGEKLQSLIMDTVVGLKAYGLKLSSDSWNNYPNATRIDATTMVDYAQQWERRLWETVWLVLYQAPMVTTRPFPQEVKERILMYARTQQEHRFVSNLIRIAPIIAADARLDEPQIGNVGRFGDDGDEDY